ncbi:phage major tail tube protein, partial [Cereibacter changlensis JA139]
MALPRVIKNFNAFVDGISYFGLATEAKLPAVKLQTEAHRGAGMDGPVGIDVGMEGLSAEISFAEWSPALLKKLGRQERFV